MGRSVVSAATEADVALMRFFIDFVVISASYNLLVLFAYYLDVRLISQACCVDIQCLLNSECAVPVWITGQLPGLHSALEAT